MGFSLFSNFFHEKKHMTKRSGKPVLADFVQVLFVGKRQVATSRWKTGWISF